MELRRPCVGQDGHTGVRRSHCESLPMKLQAMTTHRLSAAIEMSMRCVAAVEHPESMPTRERVALMLERDRYVAAMSAEEQSLFRMWAAQKDPA